jgi:hypothetical protein
MAPIPNISDILELKSFAVQAKSVTLSGAPQLLFSLAHKRFRSSKHRQFQKLPGACHIMNAVTASEE